MNETISRARVALVLLVSFASLAPHALSAQRDTTTIPVALAEGLLGSNVTRIYVATPPPGWPAAVVAPPSAQLLGGTGTRLSSTVVFHFDTTSAEATRRLEQSLATFGWSRPAIPQQSGFQTTNPPTF